MRYCNASVFNNDDAYNPGLIVDSVHKSFDLALAANGKMQAVIEVSESVKKGDFINDSGNEWVRDE